MSLSTLITAGPLGGLVATPRQTMILTQMTPAGSIFDYALLRQSGGANLLGFDYDDAGDPGTVQEAVKGALDAVLTLRGKSGQLSVDLVGTDIAEVSLVTGPSIPGVAAANEASAGDVGQYLEAAIDDATPTALTDATLAAPLSLVLPAGDWDLGGMVGFKGTATSTGYLLGGTGLVNSVQPASRYLASARNAGTAPLAVDCRMALPTRRVLTAGTSTYLVVKANFSGGTCSVYGVLWARRRR